MVVDCCEGFLEYGRRDVAAAGLTNVGFLEADVLSYPFEPEYDFCFSRFGTSFFDNPVAGLRNMRRSLRPGGIMTMIVWRSLEENPWLAVPKEVVLRYLPPVKPEAENCGPGPFSMASTEVVTRQLRAAGYVDIGFEQIDASLMVGTDPEDAAAFQLALGPAGEVYREAGSDATRRHDEITAALTALLSRYYGPAGVMMDSSSWQVTARNPV